MQRVLTSALSETSTSFFPDSSSKPPKGFPNRVEVTDENAQYFDRLRATETLERRGELERTLAALDATSLVKLMRGAGSQREDLRARLRDASSAVAPDLYVRIVRLLRSLQFVETGAGFLQEIVDNNLDLARSTLVALMNGASQGLSERDNDRRAYLS